MNRRPSRPLPHPASCLLALGLFSLSLAASPAASPDNEPSLRLRQAIEEVLASAYPVGGGPSAPAVRRQLRPVLEKYFDSAALTRRSIGPGWRTFTTAQQQRAVELFSELVFRTYADRLGAGARPVIGYQPAIVLASNRQEIPTTMMQDDIVAVVAFRFECTGAEWRIYDVVIEGISLVANYRTQFDVILRKNGAAGVLQALEAKVAGVLARADR